MMRYSIEPRDRIFVKGYGYCSHMMSMLITSDKQSLFKRHGT